VCHRRCTKSAHKRPVWTR